MWTRQHPRESQNGHVPGKPGLLGPTVRHCFPVPRSPEDFSLSGFMFQFYLDLTWDTVSQGRRNRGNGIQWLQSRSTNTPATRGALHHCLMPSTEATPPSSSPRPLRSTQAQASSWAPTAFGGRAQDGVLSSRSGLEELEKWHPAGLWNCRR